MVIFLDYELSVPKDSFDIYYKHILQGIYNFKSWPGPATIVKETDTSWEIKFTMCNFVPIALVLPATIIEGDDPYFNDSVTYNKIKDSITQQLNISRNEVMIKVASIHVGNISLEAVVQQLALDHVIVKFAPCDHNVYLILTMGFPLFVQIINGKFVTATAYFVNFDLNTGFTGFDMTVLNQHYQKWKEICDLTALIIPANVLNNRPIKLAVDN